MTPLFCFCAVQVRQNLNYTKRDHLQKRNMILESSGNEKSMFERKGKKAICVQWIATTEPENGRKRSIKNDGGIGTFLNRSVI